MGGDGHDFYEPYGAQSPVDFSRGRNPMRMLPGSRKVTFCKLTDLEKRCSVRDGGGWRGTLDHRMWSVMIPLIHERADFYFSRVSPKKFLTAGHSVLLIQSGEPSNGEHRPVDRRRQCERNYVYIRASRISRWILYVGKFFQKKQTPLYIT